MVNEGMKGGGGWFVFGWPVASVGCWSFSYLLQGVDLRATPPRDAYCVFHSRGFLWESWWVYGW